MKRLIVYNNKWVVEPAHITTLPYYTVKLIWQTNPAQTKQQYYPFQIVFQATPEQDKTKHLFVSTDKTNWFFCGSLL